MPENYTNKNFDQVAFENITKFNGFFENPYKERFVNGISFIFLTKPQLFIDPYKPKSNDNKKMLAYENMLKDPKFTQFIVSENSNELDREIIKSLSYNPAYYRSNFLPIFTNESKEFTPLGVVMESNPFFETKEGYNQTLPTISTHSEAGGSFDITVSEDLNLSFTKMMTIWVNYINNISNGIFSANPDMIKNGKLDYVSSLYYFILDSDGKTIKYWSKYTGCWPTNIPYEALRYQKGDRGNTEISISFQYMIKEDMNPNILEDFNRVSFNIIGEYIPDNIKEDHASIIESPLLNLSIMRGYSSVDAGYQKVKNLLDSKFRDPIIVYRPESSSGYNSIDKKSAGFELVFDNYSYKDNFISNVFENSQYYGNDVGDNSIYYENYDKKWNETSYWNSEE